MRLAQPFLSSSSVLLIVLLSVLAGCGGGGDGGSNVTVNIDQTSPVSVPVNGTQQFSATVTGSTNTDVTWTVVEGAAGGSFSQTTPGLYTAPATVGTFHVKATSVADPNTSDTVTVNVVAANVNTAPTASFTIAPTSGTTATSFAFDASGSTDAQDATSALQVRWDWTNDGTFDTAYSTTKTANHTFATAGTFTVKLEVRDTGALLGTTTHTVTVSSPTANTAPTASFTVTPSSGTTSTSFAVNASASTDAQDPTSALQVRWDWTNDGTFDTALTTTKTASHTYSSAGTFTIRLEVRDTGGLTGTTTRSVTVTATTGVSLVVTLDPTVDVSSGSAKATSFTSAALLNTAGTSVKTATVTSTTATFDLAGLSAGTYFVRVNNLADDLVPVRIDNPAVAQTAFVGTRLRDVMIGSRTSPTFRIKTFSQGQAAPELVKYTDGTAAPPSRWSYTIVSNNTAETRVLGTAALLSNAVDGGEHPFPTWMLGTSNHGISYGGVDGRCGCHGNLDNRPAAYNSITVSNGWCFKCHRGKTGPSNGFVDPAQ